MGKINHLKSTLEDHTHLGGRDGGGGGCGGGGVAKKKGGKFIYP